MTEQTTDRVWEGKTYRQNIMDKISVEAGKVDTCRPEGEKELYAEKLEKHINNFKSHLDDMTRKSQDMEDGFRKEFDTEKQALEDRIRDLKIRLDQVRRASGSAWKEVGAGTSNALKELVDGFKSAASKFS